MDWTAAHVIASDNHVKLRQPLLPDDCIHNLLKACGEAAHHAIKLQIAVE